MVMILERVVGPMNGMAKRSTPRILDPLPARPPQIPQDLIRDRTPVLAVGTRWLTAWATARPYTPCYEMNANCVALSALSFQMTHSCQWLHPLFEGWHVADGCNVAAFETETYLQGNLPHSRANFNNNMLHRRYPTRHNEIPFPQFSYILSLHICDKLAALKHGLQTNFIRYEKKTFIALYHIQY
jgi:hypothetical protein